MNMGFSELLFGAVGVATGILFGVVRDTYMTTNRRDELAVALTDLLIDAVDNQDRPMNRTEAAAYRLLDDDDRKIFWKVLADRDDARMQR